MNIKERNYWLDTVAEPAKGLSGPIPDKADVVIVGGGFCGLAAARTLAMRGVRVVLLEAETLGSEAALARIDEAFRLSNAVEHGCSLPFLHRLRGEILLKRDPGDPEPAEEAFRTSIAIAKEQGARSPALLASLQIGRAHV